ncbi:hypothetical protein GCM10011611_38880 [Aliidongia dinghuensis]|uniref:Uncharacterized protein n=1 Tax=Aliidongia dinghuensis TaxID=1867774 RepID=A0A8J2YW01_9PROT|nr:hypothetical protein [Aliidongia dinghuensis]GGF29021.1 hypothetical protein GCM10011611_38880 [Aliidongia dinghuensis]
MANFQNITEDARLVELAALFERSMCMYTVNDECATGAASEEAKLHRDGADYWIDLAINQATEICSLVARTAWGALVQAEALELIADHETEGDLYGLIRLNAIRSISGVLAGVAGV